MRTVQAKFVDENAAIVNQWALALLIQFNYYSLIKGSYRFEEIADCLLDEKTEDMESGELIKNLQSAYKASKNWDVNTDTLVDKGISELQAILKLNDTEAALLKFAMIMHSNKHLREVCDAISDCTKRQFCYTFA